MKVADIPHVCSSAYLSNKALREVSEEAAISKAETILRKETEWMRRQPKVS